jgi:hypothetical protein
MREVSGHLTLAGTAACLAAALAGCGMPAEDDESALAGEVEAKQGAVVTHKRHSLQAVQTQGHLFLKWHENRDVQGGALTGDRVWGMTINDATGAALVGAHKLLDLTQSIQHARLAANGGQVLMTFMYPYSTTDYDVKARFFNGDSNPTAPIFDIDTTGWFDWNPTPAFSPVHQKFMVGWTRIDDVVSGAPTHLKGAYVSTAGAVTSGINLDPLSSSGVFYANPKGVENIFAESAFVTATDQSVNSLVSALTTNGYLNLPAANLGNVSTTQLSFVPSAHVVGAFSLSVIGSQWSVNFQPYSTGCFQDNLCEIPRNKYYTGTTRPAFASGAVGGNFVSLIAPYPNSLNSGLKVQALDPGGALLTTRNFSSSCAVETVGTVVQGAAGSWIFWFGCNQQIRGQRIDSYGAALGPEVVIVP